MATFNSNLPIVMNSIDNIKSKLTDAEYKELCDGMMDCNKEMDESSQKNTQPRSYKVSPERDYDSEWSRDVDSFFDVHLHFIYYGDEVVVRLSAERNFIRDYRTIMERHPDRRTIAQCIANIKTASKQRRLTAIRIKDL